MAEGGRTVQTINRKDDIKELRERNDGSLASALPHSMRLTLFLPPLCPLPFGGGTIRHPLRMHVLSFFFGHFTQFNECKGRTSTISRVEASRRGKKCPVSTAKTGYHLFPAGARHGNGGLGGDCHLKRLLPHLSHH